MYPTQYLKKCIENFGGYKVAPDFPNDCRFYVHFAKRILDHADFIGHIIKGRALYGLQQ